MVENKREENELFQDVKLLFRNFAGQERPFNNKGSRNFHILLNKEQAEDLTKRGWRVKQMKAREEGEEGDYHLKVNLNYEKGRPPRAVLVTSQGRTELGAEEIGLIDVADIAKADVMVNGWYSDMAGGGYSAFLKTIFITIREDELERMYADLPEAMNPNTPWDESEE